MVNKQSIAKQCHKITLLLIKANYQIIIIIAWIQTGSGTTAQHPYAGVVSWDLG